MAKVYTNDDPAIRESLDNIITQIDPTEYPLYTGLKKTTATSTRHQWLTDTLKTPASNAQVEGSDAAFADRTDPVRVDNWTQIVRIDFDVTDTERSVTQAGFSDRYAYEMNKAMTEWKNDAEFALMRSTIASGSGSAARQMVGVKASITTNATNPSGVSLSETMFNDYMQNVWLNSNSRVTEVYVPAGLKRRISSFTAGSTKFTDVTDKRLTNTTDVYEGDFGAVKLFLHRYVSISGTDTNNDMVGINPEAHSIAHLREPKHIPLAKTGSSTKGMIEGEFTHVYRNEAADFKTTGLL